MSVWYHFEIKFRADDDRVPPTDVDELLRWLADPSEVIHMDGALLTKAPENMARSSR